MPRPRTAPASLGPPAAAGEWLRADEAAAMLGVTKATLYAYVSRGKLAASPGALPQTRVYRRSEVETVVAHRARGRRPREVARAALAWGLPVLESALTLIDGQRLHYRGQPVAALARTASAEDVACLMWQCRSEDSFGIAAPRVAASALRHAAARRTLPLPDRLPAAFMLLQADATTRDPRSNDSGGDPRRLAAHAGALLRLSCAAALGTAPSAVPLHAQFGSAWGLARGPADAVRASLVQCADHELNASGFVARCVASTGADLGTAVAAGMLALSGARHGGMTARVEAMWDELARARTLRAGLLARLARGDEIAGFGHPLYPDGDPRAAEILARLPAGATRALARRIAQHAEALTGHRPALDFALVALRRAIGAPEGGAYAIFAVGRTIGWIAHALEQRAAGGLIRPRAAYTGVRPTEGDRGPLGPRSVFER